MVGSVRGMKAASHGSVELRLMGRRRTGRRRGWTRLFASSLAPPKVAQASLQGARQALAQFAACATSGVASGGRSWPRTDQDLWLAPLAAASDGIHTHHCRASSASSSALLPHFSPSSYRFQLMLVYGSPGCPSLAHGSKKAPQSTRMAIRLNHHGGLLQALDSSFPYRRRQLCTWI